MDEKISYRFSCVHNIGVECYKKNKCDKCGWNPQIAEKRKEKAQAKYAGLTYKEVKKRVRQNKIKQAHDQGSDN